MLPTRVSSLLLITLLAAAATACNEEEARRGAEGRFASYDRNGDGMLTPEEVDKPALFKRVDTNADGVVTRAEVADFFAARRGGATARPGAQGPSDEPRVRRVSDEQPAPAAGGKAGVREFRDIPYAKVPGVDPNLLSLDVYAPPDDKQKRPVVIMVHGGGWRRGDKGNPGITTSKVPHFTGAGFVYVAINYRLSPKVLHPVHSQDVAKAIAWVHDHAARYGGDADRIYLLGHSAGAHLAALVATDEKYLQAQGKDLKILKGVVLLDSAGYDIPRRLKEYNARPAAFALYENAFGKDEKTWADASPARHIAAGKGIPPMLIFSIDKRETVSQEFVDALRRAGVPAAEITVQGKDHEGINNDIGRPGDGATKLIMEFLRGKNPRDLPDSA
jgi:acetyl esterase/lipase